MDDSRSEVTELLLAWSVGDEAALNELMPLVATELRRIAERYMRQERRDHTLQPTALVNELYLRLVDQERVTWQNRAHFFGTAAQMMRRILVDHARIQQAEKRDHGEKPVPLDEDWDVAVEQDRMLLALDDALAGLAKLDERQSRVVELRFFAGLTYEEIGDILKISAATVKREWRAARLWLYEQIHPDGRSLLEGVKEDR